MNQRSLNWWNAILP